MIDLLPPLPMYADTAIRFRDPFSKDSYNPLSTAGWTSRSRCLVPCRNLTPPPEMNGISRHSTAVPSYHRENHTHYYGDSTPGHATQRALVAPHMSQESRRREQMYDGLDTQHQGNGTISPEFSVRQATVDTVQPLSRRTSQGNNIAAPFRIPRSVNDSGGSLSELAAQITCLFWFESSELLQLAEESPISTHPPRLLATEAKPTTGFRKWVTTILSTTLVAQNVVLLALLFIHRLKKLNPGVRGKPGSEYRLLTVALMLGNKFLDDNTYTNKTWAEVSGINVAEVHIMEVEFLSNMKYCLFTSAEDWSKWQTLLGKFAAFFDRASRPVQTLPPPILPPASSLQLPMSLPSPPASTQASPPYSVDAAHAGSLYSAAGSNGPTPAPSPLSVLPNSHKTSQNSRKRSLDESSVEPPAKRMAARYQDYRSPSQHVTAPTQYPHAQHMPRLPLPNLSIPQPASSPFSQAHSQGQQLAPMEVTGKAMPTTYPSGNSLVQVPQLPTLPVPATQSQVFRHTKHPSRQISPAPASAVASPMSALPQSATSLHPPAQVSPTYYYLQQRNSPYRPVHNVSTLTCPPSSTSLQHQAQNVEYNQMHYQPLGKPSQQRQTGRLPYIAQNIWLDGNGPQAMTPVNQWPSFSAHAQQRSHTTRLQ